MLEMIRLHDSEVKLIEQYSNLMTYCVISK